MSKKLKQTVVHGERHFENILVCECFEVKLWSKAADFSDLYKPANSEEDDLMALCSKLV